MASPPTPRSRFGIRFSLLARRWRHVLDGHLARAGLTDATWVPLIHLSETGGGLAQKDLAMLVGVDGSSLVRVLDILERQGLIERRRSETDGRARLVHLTPAGERRVAAIRHELGQGEQALLADLSEEDIATLLQCFDRIDRRITGFEDAAAGAGEEAPRHGR
ncbi:MAG TPA: MarR family transcriptional regulator [Castellaniella sp.]|jgi:MarR family transcriptional regulator for hemolysin|nr:MarR family transcriptional regulator [Castellaniella sp.]